MKVKLNVSCTMVHELNTEDYVDQWHEYCDDEGEMEEGADYPEVPEDFAIESFKQNLEDGEEDLGLIMESATIDVQKA